MSVILYKPGNTRKVRGVPCDILVCDEYSYLHNLEQGYFYSPEECYAEKEDEAEPEETEQEAEPEAEEETETDEPVLVDPAPEDEIRAAAKAAGIKSWHNKRIERLVKELKELEDGE